jgi:phosphoglycerate-specific signal transduction histidine kinase
MISLTRYILSVRLAVRGDTQTSLEYLHELAQQLHVLSYKIYLLRTGLSKISQTQEEDPRWRRRYWSYIDILVEQAP